MILSTCPGLAVPCSYWMPDARGKVGVESCGNRCCSLGNLTEKSSYICLKIAKMQVKLKNVIHLNCVFTSAIGQ